MSIGEIILNIVFYLFAVIAVLGALGVALFKNIVRSAFALLAVLISAAAFYAILGADFIMAIQILVYIGGILVLIIFAVMLTSKISDINVSNVSTPTAVAFFSVLCIFFTLITVFVSKGWQIVDKTPSYQTEKIGTALMNEYLLPFEIVSVLLLAALIGAAYIVRKEIK
jgi:NADH-quinone oxidoreductase subunit J